MSQVKRSFKTRRVGERRDRVTESVAGSVPHDDVNLLLVFQLEVTKYTPSIVCYLAVISVDMLHCIDWCRGEKH